MAVKAKCGSFSTTGEMECPEILYLCLIPSVILLVSVGDRMDKIDTSIDTRVDPTRVGKLKSITMVCISTSSIIMMEYLIFKR